MHSRKWIMVLVGNRFSDLYKNLGFEIPQIKKGIGLLPDL